MLEYPEYGIRVEPSTEKDSTKDVFSFSVEGQTFTLSNNLEHQPKGIKTLSATLGIKKSGKPDFAAVIMPRLAPAAAVFTRSRCPGVAIIRGRQTLAAGKLRGLIVNSGNANVFTPSGEEDLDAVLGLASKEFDCSSEEILMCSTGVIGVPLPMEKFRAALPGLAANFEEDALDSAASAILTTDLGPKTVSFRHRDWIISGIAKGAGMIEPNLATLLVFFFTNVKLSHPLLQSHLENAVESSFNSLSIDGDMSTSDTVALFSTGDVPLREDEQAIFASALRAMAIKLGRDIVSQGEGVSKLIECVVETDISPEFAKKAAKLIINSPLVKTAVHGGDPNWGRIVSAVGKSEGEIPFEREQVRVSLMGTTVFDSGKAVPLDLMALSNSMKNSARISIMVGIGAPTYRARVWGGDLTEEYVRFNSDYTS